ncbi:hypothetical protein IHN32_09430 [Deinococcus sp. 14RED07]|uniref:hypothetical protein n=1 Tax=Deinococcus sp. 14RED07 TaxID=2745874 RepID=UPI001E2941DF|nr:hypothetical protein [Deinococcus sp. 14RED07]MCD0176161.1 hypothetical protein [Deinococcus sp. 14RED07]
MKIDLCRARQIAVDALGPNGDDTLAALDAAGLVVVLRRQLPRDTGDSEELLDVQLATPANVTPIWGVTVTTREGEVLQLVAAEGTDLQIGEAVSLQSIMGHRINVMVDREGGLLLAAVAVEL